MLPERIWKRNVILFLPLIENKYVMTENLRRQIAKRRK
jgi:hypothetical protein